MTPPSTPSLPDDVRRWQTWEDLWSDEAFHAAWRVVARAPGRVVVRHWTGPAWAVALDAGGGIGAWKATTDDGDPSAWSALPPGRRGPPIAARTRAEAIAVVRCALQQPGPTADVDGEWLVRAEAADGPRVWRFRIIDAAATDRFDLGPGASAVLDPADLVLLASHLEREVDRAIAAGRAGPDAAAELRLAAVALDQVQRFAKPISAGQITTAAGQALYTRHPERFDVDHLLAEALRLHARADAIASLSDAHPDAHLAHALRIGHTVPTVLDHLGADLLERFAAALDEASGHLREAEHAVVGEALPVAACAGVVPPEERRGDVIRSRRALLDAQRQALREAHDRLPALPPWEEIPVIGLASPAGVRVPQAGDRWAGPPDGFLPVDAVTFRHEGGATLQVTLAGDAVVASSLATGAQAMRILAERGHVLLDAQQDDLYAHLEPGSDPRETLAPLVRGPWRLRPFVQQPAGDDRRLKVFVVDAFRPLWRSALLLCVVDAEGRLLWPWLVEGEAAVDQLLRLSGALATPPLGRGASPAANGEGDPLQGLIALAAGGDEVFYAAVRPRQGDAARAFVPDAVDAITRAQVATWRDDDLPALGAGPTRVTPHACTTEGFAAQDEASRVFAGGWRGVAHLLAPGRTWASLTFAPEGATRGLRLEGFVWLDDHWAFFPKPWRGLPDGLRESRR